MNKTYYYIHIGFICLLTSFVTMCGTSYYQFYEPTVIKNSKEITSFMLDSANNTALSHSIIAEIDDDRETITLPISSTVSVNNLKNAKATFETTGKKVEVGIIQQKSGETPNDFTRTDLAYTVTAENGRKKHYMVVTNLINLVPISINLNGGSMDITPVSAGVTGKSSTFTKIVEVDEISDKRFLDVFSTPVYNDINGITRTFVRWEKRNHASAPWIEFDPTEEIIYTAMDVQAVWKNNNATFEVTDDVVETEHPTDLATLKKIVNAAMKNHGATVNLNYIDTSAITDMTELFDNKTTFNGNISTWNTTNVTIMKDMFRDAMEFNQDISKWNTSSVKSMETMFWGAITFNQDISAWDTASVTNMLGMFQSAMEFNQDVGNWDVSNVTDMSGMFYRAASFNKDISRWTIISVINMNYMLEDALDFAQDLRNWGSEDNPFSPSITYEPNRFDFLSKGKKRKSGYHAPIWPITITIQ